MLQPFDYIKIATVASLVICSPSTSFANDASSTEPSIGQDVSTATQNQVITSGIKIFLQRVIAEDQAFIPAAVRKFVINNFDNISISLQKQVSLELKQSKLKFGASIIASIIVDKYVEYATKEIVSEFGYGLGGATTAAVNEHIIRLGANIVMSGGNPADVAIAQGMVLLNVGVNLKSGLSDAVHDGLLADVSLLKLKYSEAREAATKRIAKGDDPKDVLRDYDQAIKDLEDFQSRKMVWLSVSARRQFTKVRTDLFEAHQGDLRKQLVSFSNRTQDNVLSMLENELKVIETAPKTEEPPLVVSPSEDPADDEPGTDNSDSINEGNVDVGEDNKPDSEEPTGPTPEEIAAQLELLEGQRESLHNSRDSLYIVKLQAEALIDNNDDRLAILEFDEQEKAVNALSIVDAEIQNLRDELDSTGLSAADQTRLQDLMRYGTTLEGELDRISNEIATLEAKNTETQATLDTATNDLATNDGALGQNSADIIALNSGYSFDPYTIPTVSNDLTDWTDYEYELPPFNPTELQTSDLSNVVGHAVSGPVVGGNNRVTIDLVSEDNTILDLGISGAITEIEDESSDLLDGFTHIYFGSGVDENGDDSQWVYGEAATPEQFALRTGTATFNGGLSGYYAHGTVSDHTLYQDGVSGELALEVDFGTNRLTGEGEIEINTAVRSEALAFSLDESIIAETDSGLTRSLGFNANATLENESTVSGNLGGTFYGDDASEAAGSFAFDLGAGFSAGLWAAGENYVPNEGGDYPVIVSYSDLNGGITDRGDGGIDKIPELGDTLQLTIDGTATTVTSVSNVQAGDYDYTSMGQWTGGAPSSPINTGYWVAGEATPTSGLDVRTGSATFAGNIIGDYVPFNAGEGNVVREDAGGTIRLTADFSQDQIDGEMQFVSANHATNIITLTSPISSSGYFFESNGVDFDRTVYTYGFSGTFFGSSADELGGSVYAVMELGSYNGVFRAGENLSFGGFVTPTATQPMDYSNYRGLAAYVAVDSNDASIPATSDFVTLNTINSNSVAYFENTSVTNDVVASTDSLGQDYSYTNWGSWQNGSAALVDGVAGRDVNANWIVYDATTDLRTTGQATYNGDAVGLTSNGGDLTGDIQLTADFANDRITGTMDLFSAPQTLWADASFDTSITRDTNASGFQGALTGSNVNSGVIFGGFAGPNAEEVGGGWQIDNANGSGANGIFRAQN